MRSNGFGCAFCGVGEFVPNKYADSIALVRAYHRAAAQFSCPRVRHRDPFGVSIALLENMLKLEADRSSIAEWVADLRAAIDPQATAV